MDPAIQLFVIGFHHRKGHQVEYCFPPISAAEIGDGTVGVTNLPLQWSSLPSLSLPDGAHNVDSDVVYFILPSIECQRRSVYGVACYKQIAASEVQGNDKEITRSSVQKSVCILSKWPLYGVISDKLALITHAYFGERDFAKVEVLKQMCSNLLDLCNVGFMDSQTLCAGIPLSPLLGIFKHKTLVLFKLLLLERRVIFNIFPAKRLGEVMLGLISLFPLMLEEGLSEASAYMPTSTAVNTQKDGIDPTTMSYVATTPASKTDELGFPLAIFAKGSLFHPYLSIDSLDLLRSEGVRAYCIGVTNSIFLQKRELFDVIASATNNEEDGQVEIITPEFKRQLTLTKQDTHLMDFILRVVDSRSDPTSWEGSDDWVRSHFFNYLLSLLKATRLADDGQETSAEFNRDFICAYKESHNYRIWASGLHCSSGGELTGGEAKHPFAGSTRAEDLRNDVERTLASVPWGARSLANRLSQTHQFVSDSGNRLKNSLSAWAKK